jgi:Fe2+ or Zn2+ uptake regulation protein
MNTTPSPTDRLRMTRQRQVILEVLRAAATHPTGEEVHRLARVQLPRISLSTVYRNLELLAEAGSARRLELGGAQRRYDGRLDRHHHLRCLGCGRVQDVAAEPATGLEEAAAQESGYEVLGYHLELVGYCPACRQEGGGEGPREAYPNERS